MPCSDGGPTIESEMQERLDNVTRLLCAVCRKLEKSATHNIVFGQVNGLPTWWEHHKELDKQRKRNEQRRKQRLNKQAILNKLTLEERRVLGY